jgi:NADPH:quinone reductase
VKAARIHHFGAELSIDEVAEPQPTAGEIVVELAYVGVNPLDVWVTQGTVAGGKQRLPFIPGTEGVGVAEGEHFVVNAPGYGTQQDGLYAQRAAVPRMALVPLPPGADHVQAAALGVVGVTAWRLVRDVARVGAEDRVLVLGASGGVGSLLLQLCRSARATTWGQTSSAEKSSWVEELGAERAVVAGPDQLAEAALELRPTVVFDPLGDGFTAAALQALEPHGRLALFGVSAGKDATLNLQAMYRRGIPILSYSTMAEPPEKTRKALEEVLAELAGGRLRVPVDEVLPLDRAAEAHRRILDQRVRGKLILAPGSRG